MSPSSTVSTVDDVIVSAEPPREGLSEGRKSAEADALLALSHTLARAPDQAVQQLVNSAMKLARAESAGVSVEDTEGGEVILRWIATAGEFARYQNGTMPRNFSPCGTAMDRRCSLVMRDPVRYYPYISQLHATVRTALLVPFARRGRFVGTLWVVAHADDKTFDAEEKRIIEGLATFASAILDSQELRAGKAS
ncbi:MAG: GAF domain-containing protein [Ramlibacter sp.]